MKRMVICLMFVFFMFFIVSLNVAGEAIQFKGGVQVWLSHAERGTEDAGYGFTLRRVRLKPYGSFSDKIKWTLHAGWDKQSAKLIEVYLDFLFSKGFNLRVGQFTPPGTISSTLTSSFKLDFLERPMVTEKWGDHNDLTGFRSIGIQVDGKLFDGKLYYALMAANPKTSDLFNPGIKSSGYSHDNNGIMFWGRLETQLIKGLKLGAFMGTGKETDTDYVRTTYGAHFFYENKGINFKVEYIAGKYGIENLETKYNGFYVVLGYKIRKVEPIVRFDAYSPKDGTADSAGVETYNNYTVGINYFYSKNITLQANFLLRDESMAAGFDKIKNNIFYVCCQYTF
jgi:hypothetical protein